MSWVAKSLSSVWVHLSYEVSVLFSPFYHRICLRHVLRGVFPAESHPINPDTQALEPHSADEDTGAQRRIYRRPHIQKAVGPGFEPRAVTSSHVE